MEQEVESLGVGLRDKGAHHLFVGAEDEHTLGVVALFDSVNFLNGVGTGGVAANAPDGVGGVE